jgi:hypothetical protein
MARPETGKRERKGLPIRVGLAKISKDRILGFVVVDLSVLHLIVTVVTVTELQYK